MPRLGPAPLVCTVLLGAACAATAPRPDASLPPPQDDRALLERLLSGLGDVAPEVPPSLKPRAPSFAAAKGDTREVYRKVAPATVLVRTPRGFGSGVFIDVRGDVLTNHHVIAAAETVDFKLRVEVQRGRLNSSGSMEPFGPPLTAWVLKSDPLLDLAVLRLDAPPAELHSLKLAARDPSPGEPVSALGHGGIGLLWAIKDGEVNGIGRLSTHLAQLVGLQCAATDEEACKASSAASATERKLLEQQVPGLVIQSSCTISPGDSGGPLVNRAGELVGVNAFLRSDSRAPVTTNFHIHVKEVRAFLKEVPTEPPARAPSPWDLPLTRAQWADADGDGKDDVLVAGTPGQGAVAFADLLQVSAHSGTELSAAARAAVRADVAVARVRGRALAWYDLDGDGAFDRLVVEQQAGLPARAYRLDRGLVGAFLGAAKPVDPSLLPDEARRARLAQLAPFLAAAAGLSSGDEVGIPSPSRGVLRGARLSDGDGDGLPDTALVPTLRGPVVIFDPAQSSFPLVLPRDLEGAARAGELFGPVAAVETNDAGWYLVGRGGKYTQAFRTLPHSTVVRDAWTVTEAGEPGPQLPLWVGRDALHAVAGAFTGPEQVRLRTTLGQALLGRPLGAAPPGAFPHPVRDIGSDLQAERSAVPEYQWAVASVRGSGSRSSLVFELDRAALAGFSQKDREDAARRGAVGTDFAWLARGEVQWFEYDADHDGAVDLVIVKLPGAQFARRIVEGVVADAPELAQGPPVRPSLFKDTERAQALRALAAEFFDDALVEPAR